MRKTNYPWSKGAGAVFALFSAVLLYVAYRVCREWILLLAAIAAVVYGVPMVALEGQKKLRYVEAEVAGHREAETPPENYDRMIRIGTLEVFGFMWILMPVVIAFCGDLWKYVGFHVTVVIACVTAIDYGFYDSIGWGKKYLLLQLAVHASLTAAAVAYRVALPHI